MASAESDPTAQQPVTQLLATQQAFAQALHYQKSPVVSLLASGCLPSEQLLQVYRNNFIISLSEVLATCYPCVQAVVGEDCFAQLARTHVLSNPLSQGDVSGYGDGFADTIAQQPNLACVPYLSDLARIEWQVDQANQLPVAHCDFPFAQLSHVNQGNIARLKLEVTEPIFYIDSAYPVASLWQMISQAQIIDIDLQRPEAAIIQRRPSGIVILSTNRDAIALLDLCCQQRPPGEASAPMLAQLNELLQQQLFTAIRGLTTR